jgi:uncharacterized membrane protein YeaQ/YmgE (transglycosylase-associated protein family)
MGKPYIAMTIGKILVWLIVGTLAGTLAGRLVTFSKKGLGFWTHVGLGMLGALVGGVLFSMLRIDLGLGELKVTGEDLVAAFVGSLICLGVWSLIRKYLAKREADAAKIGEGGSGGSGGGWK